MASVMLLKSGLILSLLLAFSVHGRNMCMQNWACIEIEHSDNGRVEFYLRNKKAYTITMTVDVRPRNLYSQSGNSATKTIKGNSRVLALSFTPIDDERRTRYYYDYNWAVGSLHAQHDDDYLYRLPYGQDSRPYVVQGFNGGFSHRGLAKYAVDFAMPDGTEIYAAREGTVVDVEYRHNRGGASRRFAQYANFIVIEHSDGTTGEYYHLQQNGVFVRPGDKVKRGQRIGLSGSTGFTSLPHLHFAVYKALADGETQSLPFKFVTRRGIVDVPRSGRRYRLADE